MTLNSQKIEIDLQELDNQQHSQTISNDLQSYKLAKFIAQNNKIRQLNLDIIQISQKSNLILQQAFSLLLSIEHLQVQTKNNEDTIQIIDLIQSQSLDIQSIKKLKFSFNSFVMSQEPSNKICNFIDKLSRLSNLTLIIECLTPSQCLQSLENSLQNKKLSQLALFMRNNQLKKEGANHLINILKKQSELKQLTLFLQNTKIQFQEFVQIAESIKNKKIIFLHVPLKYSWLSNIQKTKIQQLIFKKQKHLVIAKWNQ
ncbi:hypothetical protein ABPG74_017369 [Tetrahymena malaccensis]